MPLHVRPLRPDEWPLYRDLRLAALLDAPDAYAATHAEMAAQPDAAWAERLAAGCASAHACPLVAQHEDRAVGLAWIRLGADDPTSADLYQVWVAPGARGHGVGMALLDAAAAWARAAGARTLRPGVTWNDGAAVRLYRRAGFEPAGPVEPLRAGSALVSQPMRLTLAAA